MYASILTILLGVNPTDLTDLLNRAESTKIHFVQSGESVVLGKDDSRAIASLLEFKGKPARAPEDPFGTNHVFQLTIRVEENETPARLVGTDLIQIDGKEQFLNNKKFHSALYHRFVPPKVLKRLSAKHLAIRSAPGFGRSPVTRFATTSAALASAGKLRRWISTN